MVMEWVPGVVLSKSPYVLKETPIKDLARLLLTITQAIEQAHSLSIIHRDLKPDNIMITPDGRVKILDFGLAKFSESTPSSKTKIVNPSLEDLVTKLSPHKPESGINKILSHVENSSKDLTQVGMAMGSPGYMSPEQATGDHLGPAADMFALGVIAYQLLTGQRPFKGGGLPVAKVRDMLVEMVSDNATISQAVSILNAKYRELGRDSSGFIRLRHSHH